MNGKAAVDIALGMGDQTFQRHVGVDLAMAWFGALVIVHDRTDLQDTGAVDVADELLDIGIAGIQQDMLRLTLLDDEPVFQDDKMVGKLQRLVQIVGDEDNGFVKILLKPQKKVLHRGADQRVERGERLVHQHHLGIRGQRPRKPDTLLHSA